MCFVLIDVNAIMSVSDMLYAVWCPLSHPLLHCNLHALVL